MTEIINECWRTVSEYNNYQVSNIGRVRNVTTSNILTPINKKGYHCIGLYKNSGMQNYRTHALVAQEFIVKPTTYSKLMIDHIDRNKQNNQVNNLRWVSNSQNQMNRN